MIFFSLFIFSLYVVPIYEIHIFIVSLLLLLLHTCISVMTILAPDFSIPSSTFDDELSVIRALHSNLECEIIFKECKTKRRYQNLHLRLPPRTHNILATCDPEPATSNQTLSGIYSIILRSFGFHVFV